MQYDTYDDTSVHETKQQPEAVVSSDLTSVNNFQSYHDSVWFWQGTQCSLIVLPHWSIMPQDTRHDTTPSHIILTLGWPVLALLSKYKCQARSS